MGEMILCKLTLAYVKTSAGALMLVCTYVCTLSEKERKKRYYGRPCPMNRNTLRAVAIKLDRLFAHVHVHTYRRTHGGTTEAKDSTYADQISWQSVHMMKEKRPEKEIIAEGGEGRERERTLQYQSRVERDFAEYVIMNTSFSFTICSLLSLIVIESVKDFCQPG